MFVLHSSHFMQSPLVSCTNILKHSDLGLLLTQLYFVCQLSWLGSKAVSAAWTPQTLPLDENLANLAPALAGSVSSDANRLACLILAANIVACHSVHTSQSQCGSLVSCSSESFGACSHFTRQTTIPPPVSKSRLTS